MSALVIAAPSSGQGKTLFTFGLLRALKNKGYAVTPFKTGPDYIDSKFHEHASARTCRNLDPWAMDDLRLHRLLMRAPSEGLKIIEGVMGLFDGAHIPPAKTAGSAPDSGVGTSTAGLAIRLGVPVVLVVDCKGMAQSVAALVQGFARFNPDVRFAGVVLNRVASPKHAAMLRAAMLKADMFDLPVLGCLPRVEGLELGSRHLGLIQASETDRLEEISETAAQWVTRNVDLEALVQASGLSPVIFPPPSPVPNSAPNPVPPLGRRTAVARDEAFAFSYAHLLEDWQESGTLLSYFSPLANEAPDSGCDSIYLPGGYPELYAGRLAANRRFLDGLHSAKERGAWIYGECGGFMVLGEGLIDAKGQEHAMAGLLPVTTAFTEPKRQLGYRRFITRAATPFGPAGTVFRGHEFHFSAIRKSVNANLFDATDAAGENPATTGLIKGRVFGSYLHLIDT